MAGESEKIYLGFTKTDHQDCSDSDPLKFIIKTFRICSSPSCVGVTGDLVFVGYLFGF